MNRDVHRQTCRTQNPRGLWQAGRVWLALLSLIGPSLGCLGPNPRFGYLGSPDNRYYRDHATQIEYPAMTTPTPEEVTYSLPPRTVSTDAPPEESEKIELRLSDAVFMTLQNSEIIRSGGQFLSPGNSLYAGDRIPTVYDVAIQESGVLFGGRSVEAALAAFDATFTTTLLWGRDERYLNSAALPGETAIDETAAFDARLQKTFATGGSVSLGHEVDYIGSNLPGNLFPSSYRGRVGAAFRQPLLAGAGVEYTRIAGPIGQSFGGISGVSQGVIISKINSDIALADFETSVRNLVKDVEDAYWDLYLAYRNFDTAKTTYEGTLETRRVASVQADLGALDQGALAQAEDQLFAAEAAVRNTQSAVLNAEIRLRVLMGLPPSDGTVLVPVEEPITTYIEYDWYGSLATALMNRVELRRQKWNIRSLELQLEAARSLTQPRLDLVAGYHVNGFGDDLIGYDDDDEAMTAQGLDNMYETISQGDQTGWDLGVEFNWPIGFRLAHTQVRNYEFRLLRARRILDEQQIEISNELAAAVQELDRAHATLVANHNRRLAALQNEVTFQIKYEAGEITLDEALRAQTRRAEAELAYFQSIVDYNKSLAEFEFRKGTTLRYANVQLLESPWTRPAYDDARHRSEHRAYGWEVPWLHSEPREFAVPHPGGGVEFMTPVTRGDQAFENEPPPSPVDPQGADASGPSFEPFFENSPPQGQTPLGQVSIDAVDVTPGFDPR